MTCTERDGLQAHASCCRLAGHDLGVSELRSCHGSIVDCQMRIHAVNGSGERVGDEVVPACYVLHVSCVFRDAGKVVLLVWGKCYGNGGDEGCLDLVMLCVEVS